MPSFFNLRHEAEKVAVMSSDSQVKQLAKIVEDLCKESEEVERKAEKAFKEAREARKR